MGLAWFGSVLVLLGRALLAYDYILAGFVTAAVGDIAWLIYGVRTRLWPVVFLDVCLLAADIIGISNHR